MGLDLPSPKKNLKSTRKARPSHSRQKKRRQQRRQCQLLPRNKLHHLLPSSPHLLLQLPSLLHLLPKPRPIAQVFWKQSGRCDGEHLSSTAPWESCQRSWRGPLCTKSQICCVKSSAQLEVCKGSRNNVARLWQI